jgi:8-oxo-dGTP pyrophosphatase MutT (NUDIX family)
LSRASFIESLSPHLTKDEPTRLVYRKTASVAVIFRGIDGEEEVLIIKRAERTDDPWSGQAAFPGGMANPKDGSFQETARRETEEEAGIDLSKGAVFLGYMRDMKAGTKDVVVVPSVYKLEAPAEVTLSGEVASYRWVPLRQLAGKEARSKHLVKRGVLEIPFASFVYQGLVIWGLTERILSSIVRSPAETGTSRADG